MKAKTRESISLAMRFHILRRDKFACQYCGAKAPDTALHIEHVVPVAKGGGNDADNLCAACIRCNAGKGVTPAISDDERPLTERERRYRHFWAAAERKSGWASIVYVGGCPEHRLLLMYLSSHADDLGIVEDLDVRKLAQETGLDVKASTRCFRGLTAVGYLSGNAYDRKKGILQTLLAPPVLSEDQEHLRRPTMAYFGALNGFSSVREIHG